MELDMIDTIVYWTSLDGEIDLKNPPSFVLETLERTGKSVDNLEMTLDILTMLGRFQKYNESKVYVPIRIERKAVEFFGLLK